MDLIKLGSLTCQDSVRDLVGLDLVYTTPAAVPVFHVGPFPSSTSAVGGHTRRSYGS